MAFSKSSFLTLRGTETKRYRHREINVDTYEETGNRKRGERQRERETERQNKKERKTREDRRES